MAATHTTNLNLNKPDREDFVRVVNDINDNMDIIDNKMGSIPSDKNLQGQINTLSDQIDTADITSQTSLETLANNTPTGTTKKYWTQTASNITDYPSAMTNIGADTYVQITIERRNAVAAIHITAVKANGQSASIFGEKINSNFYWEAIPASLDSKITQKTAITVTPGSNVVIDLNKSYLCGEIGIVAVTGHMTANSTSGTLLTLDLPANMLEIENVFPITIGETQWSISRIGYGYNGGKTVVSKLNDILSGEYFHINFSFMLNR